MDESKLTPANDNPWYLMMTLHGEQDGEGIDWEKAAKNRALWNAWICQGMPVEERVAIAKKIKIDVAETDWSEGTAREVKKLFAKRAKASKQALKIPNPALPVDLSEIVFSNTAVLEKTIFRSTFFDGAEFGERTSFNGAEFGGTTSFRGTQFGERTSFNGAEFGGTTSFRGTQFGETTSFSGAQFGGTTFFDDAEFGERTFFSGAEFGGTTSFNGAQFGGTTSFRGTQFGETTFFDGAEFGETTSFYGAEFGETTSFSGAQFGGTTFFSGAEFGETTSFNGAEFGETTSFSGAQFGGTTFFDDAEFGETTSFSGAQFGGFTYFVGAAFGNLAAKRFCETSFKNAVFEGPTSFEHAHFASHLPNLTGATLHDTTTFKAAKQYWPEKRSDPFATFDVMLRLRRPLVFEPQDAAAAKASAAKLRHVMAKQALPEEEHFFFRREMHHAARVQPFYKTAHIYLFEVVSDFGYSINRPVAFLAFIWALGAAFYWQMASFTKGEAASYSFAVMFKFFGFQRTYLLEETKALEKIPWGEPIAAAQTVLAFILLFFLGLGLRTRFRLR